MKEFSESELKSKLKKTIVKCSKSDKYSKIMKDTIKNSKTKPQFWIEIIKTKHKPLLDIIFSFLLKQKDMKKNLSYMYSNQFSNEIKKKNKNSVKESFIMKPIALATKEIVKKIKQQRP